MKNLPKQVKKWICYHWYNHLFFNQNILTLLNFFFENFDKQSQKNARLVSESWQNCIDNQNILWKILFEDKDGEEAFPAACLYGNLKMAKILIQKSVEFWNLNVKDVDGMTGFHYAYDVGNSKIVEILVQKSAEFNIDFNVKDECGKTGFHCTCN